MASNRELWLAALIAFAATSTLGNRAWAQQSGPNINGSRPSQDAKNNVAPPTPSSDPRSWVTFADYPPADSAAGHNGVSRLLVDVDTNGRVQRCFAIGTSRSRTLDDAACKLVSIRGNFYPARSSAGKPVESRAEIIVDWRSDRTPQAPIPVGSPANWVSSEDYPQSALAERREGIVAFSVLVGPHGKVLSCNIDVSSGHQDLDEAVCKNVEARARFSPAVDRMGSYVSGTFKSRVNWTIPYFYSTPWPQKPLPSQAIVDQASERCERIGYTPGSIAFSDCSSEQISILMKQDGK